MLSTAVPMWSEGGMEVAEGPKCVRLVVCIAFYAKGFGYFCLTYIGYARKE